MPNHYTNAILVYPEGKIYGQELVDALTGWWRGALHRALPMPAFDMNEVGASPAWYTWALEHWGTQWDAYDGAPPVCLPGDSCAVLVAFCTAWRPPNEEMRKLLARDLAARAGGARVTWLGFDLYDCTEERLGRYEYRAEVSDLDKYLARVRADGGES